MISLERVDPVSYEHLDRYMALLDDSRHVAEVAYHLPEIFEEGSQHRIQEGIRANGALRYFVIIDGQSVGRAELSRHLNQDPSIIPRTPEGVQLGYNTCYFINPILIGRNHNLAHRNVADLCIRRSFIEGDESEGSCPWLPVSLDGNDSSRGWLMQSDNSGYDVHGDEPKAGFFPQFGIGDNVYSLQYAELKNRV